MMTERVLEKAKVCETDAERALGEAEYLHMVRTSVCGWFPAVLRRFWRTWLELKRLTASTKRMLGIDKSEDSRRQKKTGTHTSIPRSWWVKLTNTAKVKRS